MKALARSISLAILFCFVFVMEHGSHAQSISAAAPTLPPAGLVYGTTRYFNQLTRLGQFVLVDIDKDGVLDLVAPQFNEESIAISLGDAAHPGTFLPPTFVPTMTSELYRITVADLNNDGFLDLVYSDAEDHFAGFILQNPLQPGTFLAGHYAGATVARPLVADMNHDGVPDLILFQTDPYQTKTSNIAILPGDPAHPGSFLPPTLFPMVFNDIISATVADMNGDGLPDIVVGNYIAQSVSIFINDPAHPGTLLPRHDYPAQTPIFDLAVGDLNGDGHPDVVVGGVLSGVGVLLGSALEPGTLLPASTYAVSMTPQGGRSLGIALGDINGDGKLDVVSGNYGPVFDLLWGIGDGTLAPPVPYATGPTPDTFDGESMAVGDVDGDGLQDVLVGQFYQNSVQVFTHRPVVPSLAITAADQSLSKDVIGPGDQLTITIKVSAFQGTPQGSVTLYDTGGGATYLPVATLPLDTTGTAVYTTTTLQPVFHDFIAHFPGDGTYAPSTSLGDNLIVTANPTASMALTAAPNPGTINQNVTLTATITASNPAPTGTVVFLDSGTIIGSSLLSSSGVAIFNTSSLVLGVHSLKALYQGDGHYVAQEASTTETIGYPAAQITLTSSLNPATLGQSVTFQAKAAATGPAPTGTVSFRDNGVPLLQLPLGADSAAVLTTAALTVGSHPIQAIYSGDANYASQTAMLTEVVVAPAAPPSPAPGDFTLTAGPPLTLSGQQSGTSILTVTPLNGLTDTIALSCGSLPLYVTCQIAPATVPLDGTAPRQGTVQIATGQSSPFIASIKRQDLLFAAALPFLFLPWTRARTRTRRATFFLLAPLLGGLLGSLAGCGFSKSPITTPPGTYNIVVNGHSANSHLDRSTTLTLIVK